MFYYIVKHILVRFVKLSKLSKNLLCTSPKQSNKIHLLVKVHKEDNFVLNGREEVVFVDKLVDVLVPQFQVYLQSFVIALVIRVSRITDAQNKSRCSFHRVTTYCY